MAISNPHLVFVGADVCEGPPEYPSVLRRRLRYFGAAFRKGPRLNSTLYRTGLVHFGVAVCEAPERNPVFFGQIVYILVGPFAMARI